MSLSPDPAWRNDIVICISEFKMLWRVGRFLFLLFVMHTNTSALINHSLVDYYKQTARLQFLVLVPSHTAKRFLKVKGKQLVVLFPKEVMFVCT